ncbi:MAG: hypothetical protein DBX52_01970 [Clostridiales bacterium]|nr:MAG: hypothetical protein DBX52_01970 [Clostridiales bacterium]
MKPPETPANSEAFRGLHIQISCRDSFSFRQKGFKICPQGRAVRLERFAFFTGFISRAGVFRSGYKLLFRERIERAV